LGKSHYALGQYRMALAALGNLSRNSSPQLYVEAEYTAALANYQRKEFGQALSKLYDVSQSDVQGRLVSNAKELYQQMLDYLTAGQREKIIKGGFRDTIKYDLLKSSLGKVPYQKATGLYQVFTKNT